MGEHSRVTAGALGTALVVFDKPARRRDPGSGGADDRPLQEAMGDLAVRVERDWAREAVLREVTRAGPVAVRWASTGRPAAPRGVVLDSGPDPDWRQQPMEGDATAILDAFLDLPHRQLTVFGEPGAGKSAVVMLLSLELIRAISPLRMPGTGSA